jgi:PKD repeat protein
MTDRISSLDDGYLPGDLSIFPEAIDSKSSLFIATNNAKTKLIQTLTYNGKIIVVEDTSAFPPTGQLRIGPDIGEVGQFELVIYEAKTANTFQKLKRGYAGSKTFTWTPGNVYVTNPVAAEPHNAVKDCIINIEKDIGLRVSPDSESLNGILKAQEVRFLTPKPLFRVFPPKGPPPHTVRFQNFTTGHVVRYLWDFGDGSVSLEKNPIHTYVNEGLYTVRLTVITSTGAQGIATKTNYIEVNVDESVPFVYVESISQPYSTQTANANSTTAKEFVFVDQTDGDIVQRNWVFGDGEIETQEDPDNHSASHVYAKPGTYTVSLIVIFSNRRLKKVELPDPLVVL